MTYEEAVQMILPGRYRHFKGNEYCNSTWYLYGGRFQKLFAYWENAMIHKAFLATLICTMMMACFVFAEETETKEDSILAEMADPTIAENNGMYIYSVTKISGDINWNTIPVIPIDKVLWTEDYGIRAQGQLCYDDNYLYVHQSAVEKDIRAVNTEPLSPVYEDSCLEFFFMLDGSFNYFNFEINPNGCLCIQYGPEKTDRIDILRNDSAEYFDIRTGITSDGWEVFYRIPLEFIRLFNPDYRFKGSLSANMYKCGNKTMNKHYLSWTDIRLDEPNFHCPEYFGKIVFE